MFSLWSVTKDTGSPVNQARLEVITCSWWEAWKNMCNRVSIGFGCASYGMKKWQESSESIVQLCNAKPITFQVKTTLQHSTENCLNECLQKNLSIQLQLLNLIYSLCTYIVRLSEFLYLISSYWTDGLTQRIYTNMWVTRPCVQNNNHVVLLFVYISTNLQVFANV